MRERYLYKPAYAVHALTASGVIPAALATHELIQVDCDPRIVFGYLLLTVFIDAIDGPPARRLNVNENAASIDGRVIDDLLDYLTFAFIPLMLMWRMDWLPHGYLGGSLALGFAGGSSNSGDSTTGFGLMCYAVHVFLMARHRKFEVAS